MHLIKKINANKIQAFEKQGKKHTKSITNFKICCCLKKFVQHFLSPEHVGTNFCDAIWVLSKKASKNQPYSLYSGIIK